MKELINGDCLIELKKINDETIDLIYLDPPFFTQQKQVLNKVKNSECKHLEFEDSWDSLNDYLDYMKDRLLECKRVLKKTGNIFLHCDRNASHYLKVLMDKIFGENNFRSEIIWSYKRWSNSKKGLLNAHQNIYFYSKTKDYKFNTIYTDYSFTTNIDQILQNRVRDKNGITVYQKDSNGNVVSNLEKKGVPLSDVWEIPYLNPKAKERNGYPTQKPILLLEQIIKIASDEGDLVLDPFCGSGTTLAAAHLLNRQYIGIDISTDAINICKERLNGNIVKTHSQLLEKGISEYNNKSDEENVFLKMIGALPVQRNNGIDAIIPSTLNNDAIAIKFQKNNESLEEAIERINHACKIKGIKKKIIIKNPHNKNNLIGEEEENYNANDIKIFDSLKDIFVDVFR